MSEQKIRERASYKKFERLYNEMKDKPIQEQMRLVYQTMDSMSAFKSNTASEYAKESLELLIKDKS